MRFCRISIQKNLSFPGALSLFSYAGDWQMALDLKRQVLKDDAGSLLFTGRD
jgi:hypothetical protein